MKEDKKLKDVLRKYVVEDTSANFTQNIMRQIEASSIIDQQSTPLLKNTLIQTLIAIFLLILFTLLVLCFIMQPAIISRDLKTGMSSTHITQITSFLLVFWIVTLINQFFKKRLNDNS